MDQIVIKIHFFLSNFYANLFEKVFGRYRSATGNFPETLLIYGLFSYSSSCLLMLLPLSLLLLLNEFTINDFYLAMICLPLYVFMMFTIILGLSDVAESLYSFPNLHILLQILVFFFGILWIATFLYIMSLLLEALQRQHIHFRTVLREILTQNRLISIKEIEKRLNVFNTVAKWWVDEITKDQSFKRVDKHHIEVTKTTPFTEEEIDDLMECLNHYGKEFSDMADTMVPD